jgi:hypothetical protein
MGTNASFARGVKRDWTPSATVRHDAIVKTRSQRTSSSTSAALQRS